MNVTDTRLISKNPKFMRRRRMSSIPEDLYLDILLKAPVKSLLACKCVCKAWFSLISNPDFVKMHLDLSIQRNKPNLMLQGYGPGELFYSIGLDSLLSTDKLIHDYVVKLNYPFKSLGYSVQLMGSCDGIVCLWSFDKRRFCLWNPSTREYKVLPKSNIEDVSMVAFGHDYKSNNYKLLACFGSLCQVYSLGSNTWKSIEDVPYLFFHDNQIGVLVNGYFHWLASRANNSGVVIISLDISNEIFKEMELPEKGVWVLNLGVLEGCLCLSQRLNGLKNVWVMQKYGIRESWTKHYIRLNDKRIKKSFRLRLVWSFKSGEILFGVCGAGLVIYNPECGSVREPNISSLTELWQEKVYFESLVSLKSGTYVGWEEQIGEPNKKKSNPMKKNKKKRKTRA